MILTGQEILKQVKAKRIIIEPFKEETATTNSYDLHLGNKLLRYTDDILDPKKDNPVEEIVIPKEGMLLKQHDFFLGASVETIGSNHYVPMLHAKSGTARQGLFVHVTSDLVDIGSIGQLTLQLYATLPVRVYPGMCIAQVTFWKPEGEIVLYDGKYQSAKGPIASRNHVEF